MQSARIPDPGHEGVSQSISARHSAGSVGQLEARAPDLDAAVRKRRTHASRCCELLASGLRLRMFYEQTRSAFGWAGYGKVDDHFLAI